MSSTAVIAGRMRELRTRRRWSAQRLADEMTRVGVEWNRSVVTKLENKRRESVSVAELLALALVLDVPPLALLLPREDGDIQITAERVAAAREVGEWLIGPHPLRVPVDSEFVQHPGATFTRQQQYFADWPVYLRRPPTVPEVEERAGDLNKQLAARQQELQRLLAEVEEQRRRMVMAEAERDRRRERRWAVEAELLALMEHRRTSEVALMAAHRDVVEARERLDEARRRAKEQDVSVDEELRPEKFERWVEEAQTSLRHHESRHQQLLRELDMLGKAMKDLEDRGDDGS